ncbi:hypothetical protein GDO78_016642, partial [Eleutherodactylus coqui]
VLQPALAIRNTQKAHLKSRPDDTEEKVDDKPIKFTTSKGSHRRWTVAQSFGSDYARPWYKVLPVSLLLSALLLWIWSCRGPHRNISIAGPAALITEPQEQVRPALVPAGGYRKSEM